MVHLLETIFSSRLNHIWGSSELLVQFLLKWQVYLVSVCLMDQVFGFIVSMVNLSRQNPVGHLTSIQVAVLHNTQLHY